MIFRQHWQTIDLYSQCNSMQHKDKEAVAIYQVQEVMI